MKSISQKVVSLNSNTSGRCEECEAMLEDLAGSINHYFTHGFKLIHIGTETYRSGKDELQFVSVAMVGK